MDVRSVGICVKLGQRGLAGMVDGLEKWLGEQGLEVLPVLNKIDLPSADPDRVMTRSEERFSRNAETESLSRMPSSA